MQDAIKTKNAPERELDQLLMQISPEVSFKDQEKTLQYLDHKADVSSTSGPACAYLLQEPLRYNSNYLQDMRNELDANGLSYSNVELQQIRDNLKSGYQKVKANVSGAEKQELLSVYRSVLGKLNYIQSQVKEVEGRSITSILGDENKSAYERLGLANTWLTQKYNKYSGEQKQVVADGVKIELSKMLNGMADKGYALDTGEQKRYQRLEEKLEQAYQSPIFQSAEDGNQDIESFLYGKLLARYCQEKPKKVVSTPKEVKAPIIYLSPRKKPASSNYFTGLGRKFAKIAAGVAAICTLGGSIIGNQAPITEKVSEPAIQEHLQACYPACLPEEPVAEEPLQACYPTCLQEEEQISPFVSHKVKKGDTLWDLSKNYLGKGREWEKIAQANAVKDPYKLRIGKVLVIDEGMQEPLELAQQ